MLSGVQEVGKKRRSDRKRMLIKYRKSYFIYLFSLTNAYMYIIYFVHFHNSLLLLISPPPGPPKPFFRKGYYWAFSKGEVQLRTLSSTWPLNNEVDLARPK